MTDQEIINHIQTEADKELSQMETFSEDIRNKIKSEYDRMIAERDEWLKRKKEEQS